ncbi:hypothetical protein QBC38DRAFT_474416 [Podospora fimiseda]|uniref:Monooxygenase n=1 Tax=Podospora fimiseda TaxID=252190 RepID=A0AAN7BT82_9PEZI|nr:hypothetical protein QBC38DRAFT_474416 [Podospora fimiseda]
MGAPELKGIFPPTEKRHRPGPFSGASSLIKDSFTLNTLLLLGAFIQAIITLILPARYAILLPLILLLRALFFTIRDVRSLPRYLESQGVIPGRLSSQLPKPSYSSSSGGSPFGSKPASQSLVVFHLGARFQHPLGPLSPGAKELGDIFTSLNKELLVKAKEYGCLDVSLWNGDERDSVTTILGVYYFRDLEGLNRFAHDEMHRKGWEWFERFKKEGNNHLGIFHETFEVRKGGWEGIYVDMQPVLLGNGSLCVREEEEGREEWVRTLVDAGKGWGGSLGTQFLRMGRGRDGKQGWEEKE